MKLAVVALIFINLFVGYKTSDFSDVKNAVGQICNSAVGFTKTCGENTPFYEWKCCSNLVTCCVSLTTLSIIILSVVGGIVVLVTLCCCCCCGCCCMRKRAFVPTQIIQIMPPTSSTMGSAPAYSKLNEEA